MTGPAAIEYPYEDSFDCSVPVESCSKTKSASRSSRRLNFPRVVILNAVKYLISAMSYNNNVLLGTSQNLGPKRKRQSLQPNAGSKATKQPRISAVENPSQELLRFVGIQNES